MALVSGYSFGQSAKEKLDQIKKDPMTVENAAKADVNLIDKKNVVDSTSKITATKKKRVACKPARKQKAVSN